jgi:hypothetical protein
MIENTVQDRHSHLDHILSNLTLDLTAIAVRVGASHLVHDAAGVDYDSPLVDAWIAATGLPRETALELADHVVSHRDHVTAAVVPF